MKELGLRVLVVAGMFGLAGCGDPLSGEWEAKDDGDVDLDIRASDDGWEGDGHIPVCYEAEGETYCFLCPIDFEVTESGDRSYDVEGEFTGDCGELGKFEDVECELNDEGDELDCDLPGGGSIEYEKQD
jgi:hypothetical protein